MKKLFKPEWKMNLSILILLMFINLNTIAQDSSSEAIPSAAENTNEQNNLWYSETWVWMSGAVISVLVIIVLVRFVTNRKSN